VNRNERPQYLLRTPPEKAPKLPSPTPSTPSPYFLFLLLKFYNASVSAQEPSTSASIYRRRKHED